MHRLKKGDKSHHTSLNDIRILVTAAIAYFLAQQIGYIFPDSKQVIMAVWPPAGVGLASLLLSPRYLWRNIIITLFITGNISNLFAGQPFVNSAGFMTANMLESFGCAWFIKKWGATNSSLNSVKEIIALVCAATIVNAITALVGAGTAALTHLSTFWSFWKTWWVADGLGILFVTPLLVSWCTFIKAREPVRMRRAIELAISFALWCYFAFVAFSVHNIDSTLYIQPYMLFSLLAFVAIRYGQRGVTVALVALFGIALCSKSIVMGPFIWGGDTLAHRLLHLQMYLGFGSITSLLLAASWNERNMAEKMAKASRRQYRDLVERTPDLITKVDTKGRFLFLNHSAFEIYGLQPDECIGRVAFDFIAPEDRKKTIDAFNVWLESNAETYTFENRQVGVDGKEHEMAWVICADRDDNGNITGFTSTARDVTGQKRMETELQKVQKLESLGILAGGIAHDFNNLMGGIFGYIDNACADSTEDGIKRNLTKAMNTIDRARSLTAQLLTFAKGGAPIQKVGPLSPFIQETAKFVLSGANVAFSADVPHDLWLCNYDKNQIGQVIDNLIINAQQAMPAGGTISLTARNICLVENEHPMLKNGDYIKISIMDCGAGIPKEILNKIFDPFFTTKAKGQGLGLATCFSIVKKHGGWIDVDSEPGKGSTFHLYLPAAAGVVSAPNEKSETKHVGKGLFLIMDDEEVIRETTSNMLQSLGYTVVSKENGRDAVDFFMAESMAGCTFAGLIFDLTVPNGMGGKSAVEEIRKTNRDVPAFVASGYADNPVMKNPEKYGFTASICKPFRKSELSEMLDKYLKP